MLSQTAEYALRAMVALATGPEGSRTAQEISRQSQIPPDYLSKVLNSLVRAGLVSGQRGRGGGFQSVKPAAGTTVLDVISAVDPLKRIRKCPLGLEAHGENLCPLHRKIDDAVKLIEEAFSTTSIESLAGKPSCEGISCHATT
jgi:Rrf2 family transcriptional regulator, nitric oxide-sensitive transcriptional repressor